MSRILFTKVPITVTDSSLPILNDANVTTLGQYEYDALGHWLFNKNGAGNLIDVTQYRLLTNQNPGAPDLTNHSNYVEFPTDFGESYQIPDGDSVMNTMGTIAGVYRLPAYPGNHDAGDTPLLFGNVEVGTNTGGAAYLTGSGTKLKQWIPAMAPAESPAVMTVGNWYFVACAWSSTVGVRVFIGLSGGSSYTGAGSGGARVANTSNNIGIGNPCWTGAAYTSSGLTGTLEWAEFMYFNSYKTQAEMQTLYERSGPRMAAQGITIE